MIDDDPSYRNWPSLPDDLLRSVVGRVFVSPRDTLAFAGVCTAWRSLIGPLPPLLLHFKPRARDSPPRFKALSSSTSPTSTASPTLRSNLPIQELFHKACVGYSHRHLIFAARVAFIVDVFTAFRFTVNRHLPLNYSRFDVAILTAPVTDPGAKLLLLDWKLTDLLYIAVGDDADWSVLRLDGVSDPKLLSLCSDPKHGKVYGLLSAGRVFVINTNDMSWELLDVAELPEASKVFKKSEEAKVEHILQLNQNLVQCDGELMLILMVGSRGGETEWGCRREWRLAEIKTYRLDFSRRGWVEVEGIGDWCLFMDVVGKGSRVAPCRDPYQWGLKSNCIYVAGGCDSWREIPMDGTPFSHGFICPSRWPSPIWVHPTD